MHLNYDDFSVPVPSLLEICSVRVIARYVAVLGHTEQGEDSEARFDWEQAWLEREIDGLEIPTCLKCMLANLSETMHVQLRDWIEREAHADYEPIFAADGILDRKRSTALILQDEALDVSTRFSVATTFCHEGFVFEHGPNLTENQQLFEPTPHQAYPNFSKLVTNYGGKSLVELWFDIIRANGDAEVLEPLYARGLKCALHWGNDAALRYFLCKASAHTLAGVFNICVWTRYCLWAYQSFSPVTHCMLFTKLDGQEAEDYSGYFSCGLLRCLTGLWCQWLFGEWAGFLVDDVNSMEYCWALAAPLIHLVVYKERHQQRVVSSMLRLGAAKRPELVADEHFRDIVQKIVDLRKNFAAADSAPEVAEVPP